MAASKTPCQVSQVSAGSKCTRVAKWTWLLKDSAGFEKRVCLCRKHDKGLKPHLKAAGWLEGLGIA